MERDPNGKRTLFRPARQRSNFFRSLLWLSLILGGIWLLLNLGRGQVKTLLEPSPTPTRTAQSYILEAEAYFDAGKLDDPDLSPPAAPRPDAIDTYQRALEMDPNNAHAWADLARIQAYSSSMLRNDNERLARLKEAKASADKAVQLAPDESSNHAIRAFVLDWYAFAVSGEQRGDLLAEAEGEALRAYNLDTNNALALAYYAEILVDQQKWIQAEQYAIQAVTQDPNSMDSHRTYGYVLESIGQYYNAIQQYQKAVEITPNMTFLYVLIGRLWREGIKNPDRALEYFDKAANINAQLSVQNPLPYIEIARTYTQLGQFFAAARNAEKALEFDRTNATTYGQLGSIFIRARNYEGAMPLLKCAVRSCTVEENEMGKAAVQGLELTNTTVAYYYVDFGTVLAFLSRANENYCPEARSVLEEVRQKFPGDPILISIIDDSEGICTRLERSLGPAVVTTETPSPGLKETSIPTPVP